MHSIKLTPKKVAQAIGVSESSMKRWCDRGLIDFETTAGGHRRLSRTSVIAFLRNSKHSLIRSNMLGLPADIRPSERNPNFGQQEFLAAVLNGNEDGARRVVYELFLGGQSIADLGDRVISPSFRQIGIQWECGDLNVYRERRACEITIRVLSELRSLLPVARPGAPLALGGAPERDSYMLPSMLVEMVLREAGWRAQSLGSMLPFSSLSSAAREHRPGLFWLSVSALGDESDFLQSFAQFYDTLPSGTFLVVGGRALQESVRQNMRFSAYGDNLNQLESLARSLAKQRTASRIGTSV